MATKIPPPAGFWLDPATAGRTGDPIKTLTAQSLKDMVADIVADMKRTDALLNGPPDTIKFRRYTPYAGVRGWSGPAATHETMVPAGPATDADLWGPGTQAEAEAEAHAFDALRAGTGYYARPMPSADNPLGLSQAERAGDLRGTVHCTIEGAYKDTVMTGTGFAGMSLPYDCDDMRRREKNAAAMMAQAGKYVAGADGAYNWVAPTEEKTATGIALMAQASERRRNEAFMALLDRTPIIDWETAGVNLRGAWKSVPSAEMTEFLNGYGYDPEAAPPAGAAPGARWKNPQTGKEHMMYEGQWVECPPGFFDNPDPYGQRGFINARVVVTVIDPEPDHPYAANLLRVKPI